MKSTTPEPAATSAAAATPATRLTIASTGSTGSDLTPCRLLRSKKYFFLTSAPRSGEELLDGSCALWCETTQQAIGPDNGLVEVAGCVRGRSCYQSWPQT